MGTPQGTKSVFRPTRAPNLSLPAFLEEFTGPSRFKSPLSFFEKAELLLARRLGSLNLFANAQIISPYPIPAHWQILLNYLWREGILETPEFVSAPRANDLPQTYSVALTPVFDSGKTSGRDVGRAARGHGVALAIEDAYGKAVGETLERHVLTLYKEEELLRASYGELRHQHKNPLDITHLNTFLPWQKARNEQFNLNKKSIFAWVSGKELLSGKQALIPAQHVFWSYRPAPGEPTLLNSTTNGGAGGFTFEEAVLSAAYEAIERDAFCLYWLNTFSPPVMDIATFPADSIAHAIAAQCERYGLEVYFLDTTSDIAVPACVCALVDRRSTNSRVTIGGSSGFDTEKNLLSSFLEALSVSNYVLDLQRFELPVGYEPFSGELPISKTERLSFWKGHEALDIFSFFISGKQTPASQTSFYKNARHFDTVAEEYSYLLDSLRAKGEGYELYCYTAAHSALERIGYTVVKVVIPKLFPLYLREHMATLESPRLQEAARAAGKEAVLNPWPHPFP